MFAEGITHVFPLCASLGCFHVRSLYTSTPKPHPLQEQAVFRIITKIIVTFRGKASLFVLVTFLNISALSMASSMGRLLSICYHYVIAVRNLVSLLTYFSSII